MAKSRKDREMAVAREALAAARIWPVWARSLGAMIEAEVLVRFACCRCEKVYDVDVAALAMLRGREWSLIGRRARCKASRCRAAGSFVAAANRETPFLMLGQGPMPSWLIGGRPRDHEPPPDGGPEGGGIPPCPQGVDPVRWAYADVTERKRMVRRARD